MGMPTRVNTDRRYGTNRNNVATLNNSKSDDRIDSIIGEQPVPENLVKSKQRVADHGEVFTPSWMVENMLDLVKDETERIDSRFLEPACGSGNFLIPVLLRKLATVRAKYGKSEFENTQHALLALMCIYGIELLEDNVLECRENLLHVIRSYLGVTHEDDAAIVARRVVEDNVVHGDALTMLTQAQKVIVFPEWSYIGKGKFKRRDFRFDTLTQMSSFDSDTLFGDIAKHDIFVPVKDYPPKTVKDMANDE